MKIHVYTTIDESWRHGDLNSSTKKFFMTEQLRDEYFKFLRNDYIVNMNMHEYDINHFESKQSRRWSYSIDKGEEELEIIEEKNW